MILSVQLAVACYLARLLLSKCRVVGCVPSPAEATVWSLGCTAYLAHVILAFTYAHDWSHAAAWEFTAQETQRMIGIRNGNGLWVNYLFTIIWVMDAIRISVATWRKQSTNRRFDVVVHGLFAFIMFSATVIFGPVHYRYLLAPIALALIMAWRSGHSSTLRDYR